MGELLSPARLKRDVEALALGVDLVDPVGLLEDALGLFRPPSRISTVEWAEKYRKFRTTEGGALVPYDRWRTPYNIAPQNALDEPGVELVVMVKPSRSGGTTVAENYLGKMIQFGPMGDVGWYLGSTDAVKRYCERVIKPMFEDHPDLKARIGSGRSDNNDTSKRVAGHLVEWLPANDASFRNREFLYGVMDEPDGWSKFAETPETQLKGRQKNVGRRRKGIILSHPDKGWRAGVAAAWESSSRGIYIMQCPHCAMFAAAHATKFWPDVPEFRLAYDRDLIDQETGEVLKVAAQLTPDERLEIAARTAGMGCPHCGKKIDDQARFAMIDQAGREDWWMHRGQRLDPVEGIQGVPDPHTKRGFYVHGLMLKVSPAAELAKGIEEALIKYERSGGSREATRVLREYMSKQLGEIFEGKSGLEGVTSASLVKRAKAERASTLGMFPPEALFITAAVDVGAGKFDVSFRAWDLESRSWWLDRLTIRQRRWGDGRMRDIRTRERIEDWEEALIDDVLLRTFPVLGEQEWAMPVAAVAIDVSDGNVTWIGREFARRCLLRGIYWGSKASPWSRVRLVQGSPNARAPELPDKATKIERDESGKPLRPAVQEWSLGVHKLKELALERLAVNDGGPGQCYFADEIAQNYFDEYFNEPLIDGKFVRQGPNESLDLFGYEEAVRLMLKPDRKDIRWDNPAMRPPWARPVSLLPKGGDPVHRGNEEPPEPPKPQNRLRRFDALNNRKD